MRRRSHVMMCVGRTLFRESMSWIPNGVSHIVNLSYADTGGRKELSEMRSAMRHEDVASWWAEGLYGIIAFLVTKGHGGRHVVRSYSRQKKSNGNGQRDEGGNMSKGTTNKTMGKWISPIIRQGNIDRRQGEIGKC